MTVPEGAEPGQQLEVEVPAQPQPAEETVVLEVPAGAEPGPEPQGPAPGAGAAAAPEPARAGPKAAGDASRARAVGCRSCSRIRACASFVARSAARQRAADPRGENFEQRYVALSELNEARAAMSARDEALHAVAARAQAACAALSDTARAALETAHALTGEHDKMLDGGAMFRALNALKGSMNADEEA